MIPHRVLIVGNQLFANALSYLLAENSSINVIDCISSIQECVRVIDNQSVDTLIIAQSLISEENSLCELFNTFPDKTIIKANLENNQLEVITRQRIQARSKDLVVTLAALPRFSKYKKL